MVGLDRAAAVQAFGQFLQDTVYSATQIQFINQIIEYLTKNGAMDRALLYAPPFTDYSSQGLEGMFEDAEAD
jgi:type I restriction enzyme, R subunit